MKTSFFVYSNLECLLERMHACQNNPEKLSTTKIKNIRLQVTHCLQIAHLIRQKINLVVTKVKIVWKSFVKTEKSMQ